MYKLFGWLNIAIVAFMILPFILRKLNALFFKKKGVYLRIIKLLRKLHKPLGAVLFVVIVIHGISALGTWRLHTGMILGIMSAITMVFGMSFYILKKKWLYSLHKILVAILVVLLLIHLIFPSAVYYIFGI